MLHAFRLSGPDEVDAEFAAAGRAYRVGAQEHLRRPRDPRSTLGRWTASGQKLTCGYKPRPNCAGPNLTPRAAPG